MATVDTKIVLNFEFLVLSCGGRVVGGGTFNTSTRPSTSTKLSINSLRAGRAKCKQVPLWDRQDKFFVFGLTIATTLYQYMHTY
jgi:hypothetical protein